MKVDIEFITDILDNSDEDYFLLVTPSNSDGDSSFDGNGSPIRLAAALCILMKENPNVLDIITMSLDAYEVMYNHVDEN